MTVPKVSAQYSFGGYKNQSFKPFEVSRLDDDLLYEIAAQEPRDRVSKVSKNVSKAVLIGMPLADVVMSGVAHNGQLSSKLAKSASTLGRWGIVLSAATAVVGIKRMINAVTPKLDSFDKKHRVASFALDLTAMFGAVSLFTESLLSAKTKLNNKFPNMLKAFDNRVKEPLKNVLNDSFVNKRLIKPADNFLAKHPYHNAAVKTIACVAAPVIAISALLRFNKEVKQAAVNVQEKYCMYKSINELLPEKDQSEV